MFKDPLKKEARRYLIGVLILFAICLVLVAIAFLTHKKGESERRLPTPASGPPVSRSIVFVTTVA
jgi:hypothetical protein